MNEIPRNKAIPIKDAAKYYVDRLGYITEIPATETKAAAKPENEVRKLNDLMHDAVYLASTADKNNNSPFTELPKNIFTDFENRRKKNDEQTE